jgi:Ribbon-helix-helix domain
LARLEKQEQFPKDTVKWRRFDQSVKKAREAFASLSDAEISNIIDDAVLSIRKDKQHVRSCSQK